MQDFKRPNLFSLAPSELSQDAAVAWLLLWSDSRAESIERTLHRVGRDLLCAMFERAGFEPPPSGLVRLTRQWSGGGRTVSGAVDIGATHVLAIEDKTWTQEGPKQRERYGQALERAFPERTSARIYLKTGDQCSYEAVRTSGWHPFLRKDLLAALGPSRSAVRSDIHRDFIERLELIETDVCSWRSRPLDEWSSGAWCGFYMAVREALGDGEWGYVANPNGGFMGFWFGWTSVEGGHVYLQLEDRHLMAKVGTNDPVIAGELRQRWSTAIIGSLGELKFVRPQRFGRGKWMTVARLDSSFRVARPDGLLDSNTTIEVIRMASKHVRAIAAQAPLRATGA